jgi:hypothetical protein
MKQIKKKTVRLVVLAIIIIFGYIVQSCQKEADSLALIKNSEYLDVTSHYDNLSNSDFFILKLALERAEPYIEEKAGRLRLKLYSGKTINISDNLFGMIVTTLNKSNSLVEDDLFFINRNKLIPFDHNLSKNPRLKSGYEGGPNDDSNYYWWGNTQTTYLDQQSAYNYYHNFENTGKIQSAVAGVIASFTSVPVGVAITIGGFIFSYTQGNAIYNAACSGGIRIESITIYGQMDPSTPGSGTTTKIKDSNGNTVLIY